MSLPASHDKPIKMKFCVPWILFLIVTAILVGVFGNSWWVVVLIPILFCFICQSSVSMYNRRTDQIHLPDQETLSPNSQSSSTSPSTSSRQSPNQQPPSFGSNSEAKENSTIQGTNAITEKTQMPRVRVRYCPACGAFIQHGNVCENCGSELHD